MILSIISFFSASSFSSSISQYTILNISSKSSLFFFIFVNSIICLVLSIASNISLSSLISPQANQIHCHNKVKSCFDWQRVAPNSSIYSEVNILSNISTSCSFVQSSTHSSSIRVSYNQSKIAASILSGK